MEVIGAGMGRTGTSSLQVQGEGLLLAFESLNGERYSK